MNDQKCCCVNVLFFFFEEKNLEFSPQYQTVNLSVCKVIANLMFSPSRHAKMQFLHNSSKEMTEISSFIFFNCMPFTISLRQSAKTVHFNLLPKQKKLIPWSCIILAHPTKYKRVSRCSQKYMASAQWWLITLSLANNSSLLTQSKC